MTEEKKPIAELVASAGSSNYCFFGNGGSVQLITPYWSFDTARRIYLVQIYECEIPEYQEPEVFQIMRGEIND
jgi:hypothetical protein